MLSAMTTCLVLAPALAFGQSGPKMLTPSAVWKGSVDDRELLKELPNAGAITNAKDFERLVKAWKVGGKGHDVDFAKSLVLVAHTSGSVINLSARLDERGDVQIIAIATRDLRPGFRYVIIAVPREGVKTVSGKPLTN